ncbi:MAG TPA: helix-turn-helix transcriptional regulator [Bacteroidales bacterium]|jgi:transcriptional regulator with XRE-family HTH domain|nr:helix-turn-helix transcriptional regulator [Bacteroidales bacterium]
MKDRILEFLRAENKSSALFAEEIGVQPSGISHILSGRNNPSLDFILKMLARYKYLSTDWLLFGKGTMYKDGGGMQSLFDQTLFDQKNPEIPEKPQDTIQPKNNQTNNPQTPYLQIDKEQEQSKPAGYSVEKIVWFYSDGSFDEYFPRR